LEIESVVNNDLLDIFRKIVRLTSTSLSLNSETFLRIFKTKIHVRRVLGDAVVHVDGTLGVLVLVREDPQRSEVHFLQVRCVLDGVLVLVGVLGGHNGALAQMNINKVKRGF
jgi:hypothetical protein